MTQLIYSFYESSCNKYQAYLDSQIPGVSPDFIESSVKSFALSFVVSTLLSGGNPISGLMSGVLATIATTIHVTCMTLLRRANSYLSRCSNKPVEPIDSEGARCAVLLTIGGTLYLGQALGLAINCKASFYATIINYLFNFNVQETPVFATVII